MNKIKRIELRSADLGEGMWSSVPCPVATNVWWGLGVFWTMPTQQAWGRGDPRVVDVKDPDLAVGVAPRLISPPLPWSV